MHRRQRTLLSLAAVTGVTLAALAACVGSGDDLITRVRTPSSGSLFRRYVSLGGSIAAGIQGGGINESTQRQAYPFLLAQRMGTDFLVPFLAAPGCPAPFGAPFGPSASTIPCALRVETDVPRFITNVAVPQTTVAQTLAFPTGSLASLQTFLIGPRTQIEAARAAKPSFVSVQVGDQDVLSAALVGILGPVAAGGDSLLTPKAKFDASYAELVSDILAIPTLDGAVLIGVFDPVNLAPLLQPGAFFYLGRDAATGQFKGKLVNNNCSPVTNLGQPNPLAANMVSFQAVSDAAVTEINCDPASAAMAGKYLVTTAEQAVIHQRVIAINATIQAAATANGWAFVNPNQVFGPALTQTTANGQYNQFRKCQLLPTATTAAAFQAAVLNSCPVTTAGFQAPNLVGQLVSFDAVHPSAEGQVLLANAIAAAINATYGTTLPTS